MKKLTALIVSVLLLSSVSPSHSSDYDPQHTMLALNMAIVSVNRILTTQDRVVLEWEYENIINRLAIGNIESDVEMKELYDELLGFINGKRLRQEDMNRLRESYKRHEQEAYYRAMSLGFRTMQMPQESPTLKTIWGWIANLFGAGVSSVGAGYYDYQASKEQIHRELSNDSWQLTKQEIEAANKLQTTLLNSSWSLLSKYHLPNEYRLTQENVREFLSVMDEADASKRLGRLRFIERKFRVYPPYWFFRANAAMTAGDEKECRKCYERFNEVWKPVLNYDPYKLEATKYRIRELAKDGAPTDESREKIRELVEVVRDYAPPYDWGSNIFVGIVYFALGDEDEAINCVEYGNVHSGYETEISGVILAQMKRGRLDVASLPEELRGLFEKEEDINASGLYVGACIRQFDDGLMLDVHRAMLSEMDRLGGNIDIVDSQNRQPLQNDQVDMFISRGAEAIIVELVDRRAGEHLMKKAKDDNITIVFVNNEPYPEVLKAYDKAYYVGSREATRYIAHNIGVAAVRIAVLTTQNKPITERTIGYEVNGSKYLWINN